MGFGKGTTSKVLVTTILSPFQGYGISGSLTHGLRRGLYSCAASRLFDDGLAENGNREGFLGRGMTSVVP
jgi:hypothetical protein